MINVNFLIKYYGTKSRVSGIATPADWRPGDDVLIGPAGSCGAAKGRMEDGELDCKDWFFCTKFP